MNNELIFREILQGSRKFNNLIWAWVISLGGLGFFGVGVGSFFEVNLTFVGGSKINFFPQGLVMSFYGIIGLLLALYLWVIIILEIGNGYNEFNKQSGIMTIFRLGFPGKTRCIKLEYKLNEVEGVEVKENPQPSVLVRIKGGIRIPLTDRNEPITLGQLEEKATKLASFLQVPLVSKTII